MRSMSSPASKSSSSTASARISVVVLLALYLEDRAGGGPDGEEGAAEQRDRGLAPLAEEYVLAPQQAQAARPGNDVAAAGTGNAVDNRASEPGSSVSQSAPVAASSLQRTKYVAPRYPRGAQRRGLSGWVDVLFTVDIDGTVTDVSVRDSNPGDVFVSSAINAVEKWEFEPVIEDGVAIQKRAAVRMMFAIE